MGKSLKQQWSYERLFSHKGSLTGIAIRLDQIARAASTLGSEAYSLFEAARLIKSVDVTQDKELSWKKFQERKG
jgi:hypothetical protein